MLRLDLETDIRYPDGERAGVLRKVVLDDKGQASAVVMATEELVSRNRIVPVQALSEGPGEVLTINLTRDQVDELPDYHEETVPAVGPGEWQPSEDAAPGGDVFPATIYQPIMPVIEVGNVPDGGIALTQGTAVDCLDGRWGVVDDVLTDDSGRVTSFVGRPDAIDEHDRVIPIDLVQELGSESVLLNCTIADLPTYSQEIVLDNQEPDE